MTPSVVFMPEAEDQIGSAKPLYRRSRIAGSASRYTGAIMVHCEELSRLACGETVSSRLGALGRPGGPAVSGAVERWKC